MLSCSYTQHVHADDQLGDVAPNAVYTQQQACMVASLGSLQPSMSTWVGELSSMGTWVGELSSTTQTE